MITKESLESGLKENYAHDVLPTDVKRVIIPLPDGLQGKEVEYTEWDGSSACGTGFLFYNAEDKRAQFISSAEGPDRGIIIGHEGECPEGVNGAMISRSEAVDRYLAQHPNAFDDEKQLAKTIRYFQERVFRHEADDPTKWDDRNGPDMWTSNIQWLKKNFNEQDIYNPDGSFKDVISAAKKSEKTSRVMYIGPNTAVEGLGETGDAGSWAVKNPDEQMNLCTEGVFNTTYKYSGFKGSSAMIMTEHGPDVIYPKGSMRYTPPTTDAPRVNVTLAQRLERNRARCAELQTPAYRVLGSALCDYIEAHPANPTRLELSVNSLFATDRNSLSIDGTSTKSELLGELLAQNIVDEKGKILKPAKFATSSLIKNKYKVDLSETPSIQKLAQSCSSAGKTRNAQIDRN